jgi:TonB family protein
LRAEDRGRKSGHRVKQRSTSKPGLPHGHLHWTRNITLKARFFSLLCRGYRGLLDYCGLAIRYSASGIRHCLHSRLAVLVVALVATWSGARAQGQSAAPGLERLLAEPPTPVTMARLLAHAESADAVNRLREALAHESPQVRAAAARVAFVAGLESLEDSLAAALDKETVPDAAFEQSRALAYLGGRPHAARILEAWRRTAAINIPLALAAAAGLPALALVEEEATFRDGRLPLATFIRIASRDEASPVTRLAAGAVEQGNATVFGAALRAARAANKAMPDEVLVSALKATSTPELGTQAIWHLLDALDDLPQMPEAMRDAVLGFVGVAPANTPLAVFQLEIAARAAGRPPRADDEWRTALLAGQTQALERVVTRRGVRLLLTDAERETLARTYGLQPERLSNPGAAISRGPRGVKPSAPWVRSAAGYPDGLVASVFSATGCDLNRARMIGVAAGQGNLTLRPNGSVALVNTLYAGAYPACTDAVRLLMTVYTAPPDRFLSQGDRESVLVPFLSEYLACQGATLVATVPPILDLDDPAAIGIPRPRVIKRVEPAYPARALARGLEGRVRVEVSVSRTGCVLDATVQQPSSAPGLEDASLIASLQWQFAPHVVDGVARDIRVGMEYQFKLAPEP